MCASLLRSVTDFAVFIQDTRRQTIACVTKETNIETIKDNTICDRSLLNIIKAATRLSFVNNQGNVAKRAMEMGLLGVFNKSVRNTTIACSNKIY